MAEKERFELSRRYNRPTPLAGAPLRPLEYFSVYSSQGAVSFCLRTSLIIHNFIGFVNTFFYFCPFLFHFDFIFDFEAIFCQNAGDRLAYFFRQYPFFPLSLLQIHFLRMSNGNTSDAMSMVTPSSRAVSGTVRSTLPPM